MPKNNEDQFAGMSEIKTSAVKWGKPGDWVKGTLIAKDRQIPNTLSDKGEMQTVLEFKMSGGSFHGIDENKRIIEEPIIVQEGSFWSVFAKPGLANQFRNVKLGQIVALRFTEEKPPTKKGYNPTKIIKVLVGDMDPSYTGEQSDEDRPDLG